MSENKLERRSFLKAAGGAAAASLMTAASARKVRGANDRIRVAVIGVRGRGWDHVRGYHATPGVEIAYFCDVDENVLRKRLADAEKLGVPKPKTKVNERKQHNRKDNDTNTKATPNHRQTHIGIWAAQRGKDIYIEKPC